MEGMKDKTIPHMQLIIKEPWFSMIKSGEKKEEYRDIKDYYTSRFKNLGLIEFDHKGRPEPVKDSRVIIEFKNGYAKDAPVMEKLCNLLIGAGMVEWGAVDGKDYYVLSIISDTSGEDPAAGHSDNKIPADNNEKAIDEYKQAEADAERDFNNSLADDAKEFLDRFLSPNTCRDPYEREERYSPYGFEKAKRYVKTLYDIAKR